MIKDTVTFTNRTLKHITRSADTIITTALMPICFLLLFVYVFGGAIKESIGSGTYINYLLPGILLMTVASGVSYTGYRLFEDKEKGMFSRVKSMPIHSASFLWGHVITTLIANTLSLVIVLGIAFLMGFRTGASLADWLVVLGLLTLLNLAFTWLMIVPGLVAKTMTGASALAYPLMFLPFLSSAFVPTDTMPTGLRWFAEHQPITPITDTLRNAFTEQPLGNGAWSAVLWLVILLVVAFIAANRLYQKAA